MDYSYIQNQKSAVTGRLKAKLGQYRNGDTEQLFGLVYRASHVFLRMYKRLLTLNFDFSKNVKAVLRQKIKFIYHVGKNQVGNPLNNSIGMGISQNKSKSLV